MPEPAQVLVVDDDEKICRLLLRILNRAGIQATAVGTAAAMRQNLPACDLVLLDVHLPDGNGLELAGEIRVAGKRTIILSGSAPMSGSAHPDVDEFLAKPFSPESVVEAVRRVRSRA